MSYHSKLSGTQFGVHFIDESDILTMFRRPVYNEGERMNNVIQYFYETYDSVKNVEMDINYRALMEVSIECDALDWMNTTNLPKIKRVIFNDPATIVLWEDGTKTVVKKQKDDKKKKFDKEKGLAMAIAKKALGNQGNYFETFKKWCD